MQKCVKLIWTNRMFYLFILPMMVLVLLFGVYPIVKSIKMSFTESGTSLSNAPVYVGLKNYSLIFQDEYFWKSMKITTLFTGISVPINVVIALMLALLIGGRSVRRGSVFFKLSVFMPVVVPIIATSVVWKWMYNSDFGAVNAFLTLLKLPHYPGLSNPKTVLWSLGLVELWKHVGLYTVIFITNLQMINEEMYEASWLEGANYFQRTWYLTLPELKPAFSLNLVYASIQYLKTFAVSLVMTQGGPNYSSNFISYYAYSKFKIAEYGQATAMGTVLFLIVIVVSLFIRKFTSTTEKEIR